MPPKAQEGTGWSCLGTIDLETMSPEQKKFCPDVNNDRFWSELDFWSDPVNEQPSQSGGDGASVGKGGITWRPGDPGPVCPGGGPTGSLAGRMMIGPLLGSGSCGLACNNDWYYDEWPDGPPPFYSDPLDPVCFHKYAINMP